MQQDQSRRDFIKTVAIVGTGIGFLSHTVRAAAIPERITGQKSVFGLRHAPMKKVRIGVVGVGGRGTSQLGTLLQLPEVEIVAVCDVVPSRAERARSMAKKHRGQSPEVYAKGDHDFENLCKRDDIDLVYIATPWEWHTEMCLCAMNNGKHAACEVPIAETVEDCWRLVDTSEKTQRHCMMLENCCYGENEMMLLNMCRQGVFGELTRAEAAYLHDLRGVLHDLGSEGAWRLEPHHKWDGNYYPTHGLGPVAQYMNIDRGDRFDHLVSMSSKPASLREWEEKHLQPGDPRLGKKIVGGDLNSSLVRTAMGRMILVQHDVVSPEPYSRLNTIGGTKGIFRDYPPRIYVEGITGGEKWSDIGEFEKKYQHPLWQNHGENARKSGGHGGMDFLLNYRLIQCLVTGQPLDISVYESVSWSVVFPLSIKSVVEGSTPVQFPDFTRGEWKTNAPLGIHS